jgi:hypothetical protein
MPERNIEQTVKRLIPLLHDPLLDTKIDKAAGKTTDVQKVNMPENVDAVIDEETGNPGGKRGGNSAGKSEVVKQEPKNRLLQVVGIIIGSPEFQRR